MNFLQRLYHRRVVSSSVPVVNLVRDKKLTSVFQPLARLNDGAIVGHQALARAPSIYWNSDAPALLEAAKDARIQGEFELACIEHALDCWAREHYQGRMFVNMSAHSVVDMELGIEVGRLLETISKHAVAAERIVFELTEHSKYSRVTELIHVLGKMRAGGVKIALDDIKGSAANLSLWSKVAPDIVKLDSRFTNGVASNENQSHAVQNMLRVARKLGGAVVAKGVDSGEDLRKLRDLGVHFAQGIFLGSPDASPIEVLNQRAKSALTH